MKQVISHLVKRNTSEGTWGPPNCWPGPEAAFYRSFDSPDGLVLMGIYENVPLVSGNVMIKYLIIQSCFNILFKLLIYVFLKCSNMNIKVLI